MDLDRLYHLMIVVSLLGFAAAIVGLVGEILGWWNDVGELLMSSGTLLGVLVGLGAIFLGSTKGQVGQVASGVGMANLRLTRIDAKLDKLDKLDRIDMKLDKLDNVHLALDAQTGVLERQAGILEQVRDRL